VKEDTLRDFPGWFVEDFKKSSAQTAMGVLNRQEQKSEGKNYRV